MKTLTTLFNEERNQLKIDIDKATSPEQVVKLIQNRLDILENKYIGQLNIAQVRLFSLFLDTLRLSISTLTAANQIQVTTKEPQPILKQVTPSKKLILKALQGLIFLGLLSSEFSLTNITPGAWMAILLTSVLLGLEAVYQLDKNNQDLNSTEQVKSSQSILRVDSNLLLDNLSDALNTIDIAVAKVEVGSVSQDEFSIEELPELLNFIQKLMGASLLDRPQMAIELAKLLPQILREQGISAEIYRPQESNIDREYFDFEPSIDPDSKDYVTISPALMKGDRLLRRGRVIEPVAS
jgi:hypothetical protein